MYGCDPALGGWPSELNAPAKRPEGDTNPKLGRVGLTVKAATAELAGAPPPDTDTWFVTAPTVDGATSRGMKT